MINLSKTFLLKKQSKEYETFASYILKRGVLATLQEPIKTGYNNPIDIFDDTFTVSENTQGSETYNELGDAIQVSVLIKSETLDEIETSTNEVNANTINSVSDWNILEVFIIDDNKRKTPFKKGSLIKITEFDIEVYISKIIKHRHLTNVYRYKVSKNV